MTKTTNSPSLKHKRFYLYLTLNDVTIYDTVFIYKKKKKKMNMKKIQLIVCRIHYRLVKLKAGFLFVLIAFNYLKK